MVAVTICSDFRAQENKICHSFHFSPFYLSWSDGTRCHDLSFLNVEFQTNFFTLTFIKRLSSSSSLSLDPSKLLVSYRIILLPSNHLCSAYSPHSSIPSNLWAFYCLHSFAFFLQCQMVGIIKYIAFPDWLLLLSNMYLSSMSFHGLIAHFFLTLSNIPFPGYTTVYIFTALCAFSFANYK